MARTVSRTCAFIIERDDDDEKRKGARLRRIQKQLIVPALAKFPGFAVSHLDISDLDRNVPLSEMATADLVITDVTEVSRGVSYQLGVRSSVGKPLILIAEGDSPFYSAEHAALQYSLAKNQPDAELVEELATLIGIKLAVATTTKSTAIQKRNEEHVKRLDLAKRIEETAEYLRNLRMNSLADAIDDLESIATELKDPLQPHPPSELKQVAARVMEIFTRISGQLANTRGSRIALSGAVGLILGGSGWPAVTAMAISLAYWDGRDTFLKAVSSIWGKTKSKATKSKKR
jgi:hypothetical protein